MGQVVLVTGVAGDLGRRFAAKLSGSADVDRVIGVDMVPPRGDLAEADFFYRETGSLYLTRPTIGDYLLTREERQWRAHDLFEMVREGTLNVRIGGTYPLAEAARAQEDLEGRKTTGKVLLIP